MSGKTIIVDLKKVCLKVSKVVIEHNFTDLLIISHNLEIQPLHFVGSVQVSIKGYTVYYPDPSSPFIISCNFHSFSSNDKT